jgi:hypothetical protein
MTSASIDVCTGVAGATNKTIIGPIELARFGDTSLFRFAVLCPCTGRNIAVLCMPTGLPWYVKDRKKIKGKTNSRAYRIDIVLHPGNKEGYNRLIITIPVGLDGTGLDRATLFGEACVYAGQVNQASLPQELQALPQEGQTVAANRED